MRVGVAEARERFAEIIDRARRGETVEVSRRGEVVAVIGPPPAKATAESFMDRIEALRAQYGVEDWPDEDVFADVRDRSPGRPPIW